jgi:hypothetical protein|tara:strand:- start:10424 stop:10594 length:171 start_codon:yes stop_codon:yes gene_type:complete
MVRRVSIQLSLPKHPPLSHPKIAPEWMPARDLSHQDINTEPDKRRSYFFGRSARAY